METISRKQRVIYNSIANGIYQIVLLISGLILPRFILLAYGSAYNGLVASLTQFLSITEILTMGLAGVARVELYNSLACNDIEKTSGIIKAIKQYMQKATLIFLFYMLVLLLIYPWFSKDNFSFLEITSLLVIIGVGNIVTYVCGYAYKVLLDTDNKTYFYTSLRIFLTIANVFIAILLIYQNRSIQMVKFFSGVIFAIGPIFLLVSVPKIYKLNPKAPIENSWMKNQKYAAANSIALIIHENTDIILLTILTSTKMVSVYSVYNLVIKGLKGILSIFTSSMEPYFGNMWAKQEIDEMRGVLNRYEYFVVFFISVSLSAALALILPFVTLYTRGVNDTEYLLPAFAIAIVLAELVRCIRIPYLTVVQAAGKYKETQWGAFVEAGLNITVSIILTIRFGIVGVAIGTLVANLFRTIHYSWFVSHHLLNRQIRNTFYLLCWSLFNIILNSQLFNFFCLTFKIEFLSWVSWTVGGLMIVSFSIFEVIVSSFIFYKSNLRWIIKFFETYLNRIKNR